MYRIKFVDCHVPGTAHSAEEEILEIVDAVSFKHFIIMNKMNHMSAPHE